MTKGIIYGCISLFVILSLIAALNAKWKVLIISWIAFAAMSVVIPWGKKAAQNKRLTHLIAGYGLASGAMITSAAIFLIPEAIHYNAIYGGLGIAVGIFLGFAIHTLNHGLSHTSLSTDSVIIELTTHSLMDGIIIGLVYAAMPTLGLLLGIAIVSHKAPAGYAAARRLAMRGRPPVLVLIPAAAIGFTALPLSLLTVPEYAILNAIVFGIATGVFFHVAMDFLPECEVGGTIHRQSQLDSQEHHTLDKYRNRAVFYTFAGGLIVFLLWSVID